MEIALTSWKHFQDQHGTTRPWSTQGPKTTVTLNHSYNNFPFQVFKTSWENKGNPHTAAGNTLDKAIIFSIWTEKHLLKKEQAMKIHPSIHESPG